MKQEAMELAFKSVSVQQQQFKAHSESEGDKNTIALQDTFVELDGDKSGKKGRGVLPRDVSNALKHWLVEHINNPYPTEQEKREMSQQFKMTPTQINNWFINARRRYIRQKIADAPVVQMTAPQQVAARIQIPKYQPHNVQTVFTPQSNQQQQSAIVINSAGMLSDKEMTPPIQDFGSRRISELSSSPLNSAIPFETLFEPDSRRASTSQNKLKERHFSFSKYPTNLDDELGVLLSSDYIAN